MMGYGYGMMGGFGFIIPLLLIGLIIFAVVKLIQGDHKSYNNRNNDNNAIEILNQKYANGEITEEEYIRKKKLLRD